MAKKSRRVRRQKATRPPRTPITPAPEIGAQTPQPSDSSPVVAPTPRIQVDFGTEYRYVINDLRSMAVIALAMLVVLIALSYVIR
jgi:hypothetical protein